VRKRVSDCLRWEEGSWTWVPGDTFGDRIIEHDLEVERIIFMGLLRSATPEKLVGRFDQNGAREVRLTRRFAHHRLGFEAVFGADITQVLTAGASVGSLALRDDAHLVIAAIDTLLETGLAELGDPFEKLTRFPRPTRGSPRSRWRNWGPRSGGESTPSTRVRPMNCSVRFRRPQRPRPICKADSLRRPTGRTPAPWTSVCAQSP